MTWADWMSGTIQRVTPVLMQGYRGFAEHQEDPACLHVWDSVACLSLRVGTQFTCPKAARFYLSPDSSLIALVQLSALTTPAHRLWSGAFKKKGLCLAPSVMPLDHDLSQGEGRQGKAGQGRGHGSKSQPLQWQRPPSAP